MFLQKNKTVAMQRILERINYGYVFYEKGFVKPNKLNNLIDKFSDKYHINLNLNQRSYRKSKGFSNTFFTCYPVKIKGSTTFIWFLLVTKGKGVINDLEVLKDINIKTKRLNWNKEYEIVKLPNKNSAPSFTWRMTHENYNNWLTRIRAAIAEENNNSLLKQLLWSIKRVPGFRGNRNDVKKLIEVLRQDIKRIKSKSFVLGDDILFNGYVRKLKNEYIDIDVAVKNIENNVLFSHKKK